MRTPAEERPPDHTATRTGAPVFRIADAAASCRTYARREPEKTVLYQIVAENLETFLEEAREHYARPLPPYVEQELRDFLSWGFSRTVSYGVNATGVGAPS